MSLNVLCPAYKRMPGSDDRESEHTDTYVARNRSLIEYVSARPASVMCFQEVWFNDEVDLMWRQTLAQRGYEVYQTQRTNRRCDGLMTAVDSEVFEVVESRDCLFNDCGDRVATALRLRCRSHETSISPPVHGDELVLVNTHLLFPHNASSTAIRLRETFKMLEFLAAWRSEMGMRKVPIIIVGDFNGTLNGRVCRFLSSQGFVASHGLVCNAGGGNDATGGRQRGDDVLLSGADDFVTYVLPPFTVIIIIIVTVTSCRPCVQIPACALTSTHSIHDRFHCGCTHTVT